MKNEINNEILTAALRLEETDKKLAEARGTNVSCLFSHPNPVRGCGQWQSIEMRLWEWLENLFNLTIRFIPASTYGFNGTHTQNHDSVWELLVSGKANISANPMGMSAVGFALLLL